MTIATYSELVSELGSWLNRTDLDAKIGPTFIRLFEARMNRRLRSPDMEQTFSFSTVSGTTNYALSSRVRELRELYASTTATDADAIGYTVMGETVVFDDDPGDDLTITYSAYVTLSGLSSGNPTNWLLDDHPDAYLAGTLAAAYAFERDEAQAANFDALLERTIDEIKKEANQKRLPAGPLQAAPAVRE
jgi:hypothetical protein